MQGREELKNLSGLFNDKCV